MTAPVDGVADAKSGLVWTRATASDLPQPPRPGEAQLWLLSLDEPPWPEDQLWAALNAEELERASRFRLGLHRRRFAFARGALRHLLAHCRRCAPNALEFGYGSRGKPFLLGPAMTENQSAVDFNLSHSHSSLLVGVSGSASIGVDVERPSDMPDFEAIAERSFAPGECRALAALPTGRRDAFFACWTCKEAFVKATGDGLDEVPLSSFEVSMNPDAPARLLRVDGVDSPADVYTLRAGTTPDGCAWAAVVCRGGVQVQAFHLYRST